METELEERADRREEREEVEESESESESGKDFPRALANMRFRWSSESESSDRRVAILRVGIRRVK